ncbi:hypothetical protein BASA81_004494 [Batrachochytrium salamandrivorans]|nr:hypothetical protein BASA81_004494 [Batrachochytrium salamandrivorans]
MEEEGEWMREEASKRRVELFMREKKITDLVFLLSTLIGALEAAVFRRFSFALVSLGIGLAVQTKHPYYLSMLAVTLGPLGVSSTETSLGGFICALRVANAVLLGKLIQCYRELGQKPR